MSSFIMFFVKVPNSIINSESLPLIKTFDNRIWSISSFDFKFMYMAMFKTLFNNYCLLN